MDNLVQITYLASMLFHSGHIRREQGSSTQILLHDPRSSMGPCRLPGPLEVGQITLSVMITFCLRSGSKVAAQGCSREPEVE